MWLSSPFVYDEWGRGRYRGRQCYRRLFAQNSRLLALIVWQGFMLSHPTGCFTVTRGAVCGRLVSTTVPTTIVYTVCLQLQQPLHLNVIDANDFRNMHVIIRQPDEARGGPRLVFDLCVTDTITQPSYTCHKLPVA